MKNSWAVCCSRVTKNDIGALPCLWTREMYISCVWGPLVYEWCWFLPLKRSKPTKSVRLTPATTLVLSTFVAIRQGSDRCEPLTQTCICHCGLGLGHGHVHFLSVCHMIVKSNACFNSQHGRSQLGPGGVWLSL